MRNPVSLFIKDNGGGGDEEERTTYKSSSDGGESGSNEEDDDDKEETIEDDDDDNALEQSEEEDDFSSKESIRKLLEPFGKDQLVEILKEAALKKPALLSRLLGPSEADPNHRNIFIHGLAMDATTEEVLAAFSPFGKIESCEAVADRKTGRCKGFGFVCFKYRAAALRALKNPLKTVGSRIANCQLASSGKASEESTGRKIVVNNVSPKVNTEGLLAFFSQFGEIEKGTLGHDPVSGKLRGFAFFVYKTLEGCNKALEEPKKFFDGCEMYCKRAFDEPKKINYTQMIPLAGTEAVPSALQAKDLIPTYASVATSMGENLGSGSAAILKGQSIGMGPFGQNDGDGQFNPAAGLYSAMSLVGSSASQTHGAASAYSVGKASVESFDRRILVKNISVKINPKELRAFFSKFGEIESENLGYDPVSGRFRGFAFFVYKTVEGCNKALEEPKKFFKGCVMYCIRPLYPTNKNSNTQMPSLADAEAVQQAKDTSVATSMGQILSLGSATSLMGQNLCQGSTSLMSQCIGSGPTTLSGKNGGASYFKSAVGFYPALSLGGGGITSQSYGIASANNGPGPGLNRISPSVIDNYGTLSALQGLGAYQNSKSSATLKPQSGVVSLGTSWLPYFSGQ